MAAGAFYLCSKIKVKPDSNCIKAVKILTDNIMGIYIFHNVCIPFVYWYVRSNGTIWMSAVITILIMFGTAVITGIMKKIPLIKEFVSI